MVTKTIKKAFLITALLSIPYVAVKAADNAGNQNVGDIQLDAAQQALVDAYQNAVSKLEQNQRELDEAKEELTAAKAKIKQQESNYAALESHIQTAEQAAAEAEGLKTKVAGLKEINSSLRKEVTELQAQLQNETRNLQEQIQQKELVVVKQAADLNRALGENDSLNKQVSAVLTENSSLKSTVDQKTFESIKLTQELSEATIVATFQQKKAAQLQVDVDGLRAQIGENLQQIATLTTQLESVRSALKSEQEAHQATLESANQSENLGNLQLEDTQKVAELNAQIADLQGERALLTSQLETLNSTIKRLEKDLEESKKESDKNKQLLNDLYKEFERRFKIQDTFTQEKALLEDTLDRMTRENVGSKAKIDFQEKQLNSVREQKAKVEEELSQVRAQLKEAQSAQEELIGLREDHTELKKALIETNQGLQTMSTQVTSLKASHAATDANNAELTNKNKVLEAAKKDLEAQVKKQDELLNQQQDLLEKTQKQVDETKAEIADLSGKLEFGGKHNLKQTAELVYLKEKVASLTRTQQQLENDNRHLTASVAAQRNEISQLQSQKATLTSQVSDQSNRIVAQGNELNILKQEIETLKREIKEEKAKAIAQSVADGGTISALKQQIATMPQAAPVAVPSTQELAGITVQFALVGRNYQINPTELKNLQRTLSDQMNDLRSQAATAKLLYDDLRAQLKENQQAIKARHEAEEDAGKARQETEQEKQKRHQELAELKQAELNITQDVAVKVTALAKKILDITNEKTTLNDKLITRGYAKGHQGAFTAWMRQGKSNKPKEQVEIETRLGEIDSFIADLETQITQAIDAGIAQAKQLAARQPGRQ